MKQFKGKLDADQNGVLDKEEFTKWVTTQFALPGAPPRTPAQHFWSV